MRKYTISILFCLLPILLFGQKETYNWTFGENAGLSFHTGIPVPFITSSNSHEGCATISDSSGQLLFYTESNALWDRNHDRIDYLGGGDHATQSSLFVPWPGNDSLYYYFNAPVQNRRPFKYAILNRYSNGGLGGIHTAVQTLFEGSTEKQAATQHANGRDFWLVSHGFPGDSFFVYLIDSTGLDTIPTVIEIGTSLRALPDPGWGTTETIGQMKISPQGDKLAWVFKSVDSDNGTVEIFDFDNQTGQITNAQSYTGFQWTITGLEFSQNGQFLYICEYGMRDSVSPGRVWGFEISSNGELQNQELLYETMDFQLGQLQLAPNGYIYFPRYGTQTLAAITRPNIGLLDAKLSINEYAVFFNILAPGGYFGSNSRFGLPNFVSSYFRDPIIDFGFTANCIGDSVKFAAFSNIEVDSWTWDFGDLSSGANNSSSLQRPQHFFAQEGMYTISLIGYINGVPVDTVVRTLEVFPDLAPNLSDTLLCPGETVLMTYPNPNLDYTWSTGDTLSYKLISQPGKYYTIIRNEAGCVDRDTFEIFYTPTFEPDLGRDTVICSPDSLLLDASNPNTSIYIWNNGEKRASIWVNEPGQYIVTSYLGSCSASDTINVGLDSVPEINLGIDRFICEGEETSLFGGIAESYLWSTGETVPEITVGEGIYSLTLFNPNGCYNEDTVEVIEILPPIVKIMGDSSLLLVDSIFSSYAWYVDGEPLGNEVYWNLIPNQPGWYKVIVSDSLGCLGRDSIFIDIQQPPEPPVHNSSCDAIKLYPNPNSGNFTLFLDENYLRSIELTDLLGHQIWQIEEVDGIGQMEINLDHQLAEGVYFLKYFSLSCEGVIKFAVNR